MDGFTLSLIVYVAWSTDRQRTKKNIQLQIEIALPLMRIPTLLQ